MFKSCVLFTVLALVAVASAKPAVVAYSAPGVVTAQSSQYIARNYNGVGAAPIVAAAYTSPAAVAAAPVAAAAYSAPIAAAPVAAAYSAPVAAAAYAAPVASYASYYPYNAAYTVAF